MKNTIQTYGIEESRMEDFKRACSFVDGASIDEMASLVSEILTCHRNLIAYNPNTKDLSNVESVSNHHNCAIQLNLELEEKED